MQIKQLKDTEKRDKYKVYGELITTYGYNLAPDSNELIAPHYYNNNEPIKIPLDPSISPMENAKKYFDRYSKLKRTYEALTTLIKETKDEISHLESIQASLEIATDENDLKELRHELMEYGYIRKKYSKNKSGLSKKSKSFKNEKSKPFNYISSDGYHICG